MVTQSQDGPAPAPRPAQQGVYVYGILPGDIELEPGGTGVGTRPARSGWFVTENSRRW